MKFIACFGVLLLLWADQAHAQMNLHTYPEDPVAHRSFTVLATAGGCDAFLDLDPNAREVVVDGDVIRITVPYLHTGVCVLPPAYVQWTLPGVPAGTYELQLYGEDPEDFPRSLLEAVDIVVVPAAPAPQPTVVPATSWWGGLAMGMAMLMMGWSRVRPV